MEIKNTIIRDLIPYVSNSRTHSDEQIAQIAASIKEFGFTNPILIDKDNGIIAGHGRLLAARKLGLNEVPTIELSHLSESQKRAYIIADNKLALNAGWDIDTLLSEINILQDDGFDIELTGFGLDEIADLMPETLNDGLCDEDETPELKIEATTKIGDVWLLENHRLMCGDSTMIDDVEKLMNGEKADMVFTDPPYGVNYEGIKNDEREFLEKLLTDSIGNMSLSCKDGASVYMFHSDKCGDIFHKVFRIYCHFSSMLVWVKKSLVLSRGDYHSRHEPCMYGWFNTGTHTWHGDRSQDSIIEMDRESVEGGHTTPKPVCLVEIALKNSSKIDDAVLDLFGGSGSTLIACEKTNRKCYMMELAPNYCDVIIKRWQKFSGKQATLESNGMTFDEVANG